MTTSASVSPRRFAWPNASLVLLGLAVVSALIYWFGLTQPYQLTNLYQQPLLDMRKLTEGHYERLWPTILEFVALFGLYLVAWQIVRRRASNRSLWLIVIGGALVFIFILLLMYPYDAADIFDYIMYGRIINIYHANPFHEVASQFPTDPFLPYVGWRNSIAAYGPAWVVTTAFSDRLAGESVLANVLVVKSILVVFLAGSAGLIAAILRRIAPERALAGVVLFLWNPLVLYETAAHGHNDIAMLFWMLLAVWLLLKKRYTLTIVALLIGALFKYIPVLFIPVALAIAVRDLGNTRARLRYLALTAFISILLVVLAYAPFWNGIETLSITRRTQLYTTSLPAVIFNLLKRSIDQVIAARLVSMTALAITGMATLALTWRAWRDRSDLSFTRSMFAITAFYLLLTVPWFHAWYVVWIVGVAALLPVGHAVRFAVLFSFTVLSKPLVVGPQLLWPARPLEETRLIEFYLGPLVLALPWAYALYALYDTWRHRHRRALPHSPATVR